MYFAYGCPLVLDSGTPEDLLVARRSADGVLLGTLSSGSFTVWHAGRHRAALGTIVRTDLAEKTGQAVDFVWGTPGQSGHYSVAITVIFIAYLLLSVVRPNVATFTSTL